MSSVALRECSNAVTQHAGTLLVRTRRLRVRISGSSSAAQRHNYSCAAVTAVIACSEDERGHAGHLSYDQFAKVGSSTIYILLH